eukprot:98566-Chlamydomonas_euryale.AAC.9
MSSPSRPLRWLLRATARTSAWHISVTACSSTTTNATAASAATCRSRFAPSAHCVHVPDSASITSSPKLDRILSAISNSDTRTLILRNSFVMSLSQ